DGGPSAGHVWRSSPAGSPRRSVRPSRRRCPPWHAWSSSISTEPDRYAAKRPQETTMSHDDADADARPFPLAPTPIHVPDEVLADLRQRLELTRWPDDVGNEDWYYGVNRAYL